MRSNRVGDEDSGGFSGTKYWRGCDWGGRGSGGRKGRREDEGNRAEVEASGALDAMTCWNAARTSRGSGC